MSPSAGFKTHAQLRQTAEGGQCDTDNENYVSDASYQGAESLMKDFWNKDTPQHNQTEKPKSDRGSDVTLLLPLIVLLLQQEKNRLIVMALLYILS